MLPRTGYFQFCPEWGNIESNLLRIEAALTPGICDLMVLPELCTTGYLFQNKSELADLAEEIPNGETSQRLRDISLQSGIAIVAGLAERDCDRFYNSAILVTPDGRIGKYRKIHLFDREKSMFSPGNLGFPVFRYLEFHIGIMICFDWIFPESCRTLALNGADLIAHPANLVLPYCPAAMITRAIENRVYTITCNRTGIESRGDISLKFIGSSRIVSPAGRILDESDGIEEAVRVQSIDPEQSRNKWINSANHLFSDRRESYYSV